MKIDKISKDFTKVQALRPTPIVPKRPKQQASWQGVREIVGIFQRNKNAPGLLCNVYYTCASLRGYKTIHVIMLHALLANVLQIAFSANTRCLKI